MLRQLTSAEVEQYTVDDPVRPHLSAKFRTTNGRQVWGLFDDSSLDPQAVICVAYTDNIPTSELELDWFSGAGVRAEDTTAVFYTVWSYSTGAGRDVVMQASKYIKQHRQCERYVTLSPLTAMAERFHLKNGAQFISRHTETQNFEYHL